MKIVRDWAALCISVLALFVSGTSAYYSFKADQRAEEAALPVVEWFTNRIDRRKYRIAIRVRNNTPAIVNMIGADIYNPAGARIDITTVEEGEVGAKKPSYSGEGGTGILFRFPVAPASTYATSFVVFLPDELAAPDNNSIGIRLRIELGDRARRQEIYNYDNII